MRLNLLLPAALSAVMACDSIPVGDADAGSDGAPGQITGDCYADQITLHRAIAAAVEPFKEVCTSDSDCAWVPLVVECQSDCDISVLRANADAAVAEIARVGAEWCPHLTCVSHGDCGPRYVRCLAGRCEHSLNPRDGGGSP